ncbi:ABC transporter permease [uncultured Ruminococcus sp.]|uniref:ABC transporter permease n=1 Tax=uncultured Ruminococcus sp. TaxID=165186 RepID=UPI0025D46998|nr:ABC transporter permease [uncultured Ruminococcus sp.]
MARFFRLVKNEYIKVFKKLSTKIMIVLIIICALGLSGIALFAKHNMESNNYSSYDATGDYQKTIDWLKDTNGDPNEIAMWQYLIDNDIDSDDWRYDVLSAVFADGTGDMSGIKKYLDDNDWRGFCQYRLDNDILTEGEKWEYQYRLDKDISFDKSNEKKNDLIMTVSNAKNTIATMGDAKSDGQNSRAQLEDNIKLTLYQLDNDKLDNTANQMTLFETNEPEQITFWTVFLTSTSLVTVVALLAIVIAGGIVSSEFSQGTIKFLLINPVKRWKILMSKYFTVITVGYIMLAILFVVMIPITGLMHGFDGFSVPYMYVSGGEVKEMPTLLYAAEQYLLKSVQMVVMSTLAFAISSLVRSTALAIGVSVFTMCVGSTVTTLLGNLGQDWARFLVFANTDLSSISQGYSIFAQHSVTFAVGVLVAHMVVFLLTAWDGFTKRSV